VKRWSVGSKIVALSAVGLLLGIGLCSVAPNFLEQDSWQASWGAILFWSSLLGLIVGVVLVFVQGIRGDD
jgi:hypothetical protein